MIHFIKKLLNILFPLECLGCGQNDKLLCSECFSSIKINKANFFNTEFIDQVHVSASFHQPLLQKIIHSYKYSYLEKLSEPLSELVIDYYNKVEDKLENPVIIPVPLHSKRLLVRCFNQSELIAQNFCQKFKYQLKNDLIFRVKHTEQQAKLNKGGRIKNIQGAFKILDLEFVKDKNFIIIDDLYTTGSTVGEIAKLLKNNGAQQIWCLVVAKN
jgi:competence protein ComFC